MNYTKYIEEFAFKTDLENNLFETKFFLNTWVGGSNLIKDKLEEFLNNMYLKDLEQDQQAFKMKYLLIHDILNKKIYLMEIEEFLKLTDDQRLKWYWNFTDFYIPRTIWYKSFCLLQKDLPLKFKNFN